MNEIDLKVNNFKLNFININSNDNEISFEFIGKSLNYKESYIYGKVNLIKLENIKWKYSMNIYINSIHIIINDIIDKNTNNIILLWYLMLNNKKLTKGFNTIDNNKINKNYDYNIHIRAIYNDENNNILFIYIEDYIWIEDEIIEINDQYFPDFIKNKKFYYKLYNILDNDNTINLFEFTDNSLKDILYKDETYNTIIYSNEYGLDLFNYNEKDQILTCKIKYDNYQYIGINSEQGKYKNLEIKIILNESLTSTIDVIKKYSDVDLEEVKILKPLFETNDWKVNINEEVYIESPSYLYSKKKPGVILAQEDYFPPEIINKKYYRWIYNNDDKIYYLISYLFKENELEETWYLDETETIFKKKEIFNKNLFIYDPRKKKLTLNNEYINDKFLFENELKGRYNKISRRIVFNDEYNELRIINKYLNMYLDDINDIEPILIEWGWKINKEELWVESPMPSTTIFKLTIDENPNNNLL